MRRTAVLWCSADVAGLTATAEVRLAQRVDADKAGGAGTRIMADVAIATGDE
jgi:hypothetical protein